MISGRRVVGAVFVLLGAGVVLCAAADRRSERVFSDRELARQQMLGIVWRAVVFTLDDLSAKVVSSTFDARRIRMLGTGDALGTGVTDNEALTATIADLEDLGDVRLDVTVRATLHDVDASRSSSEQASAVTLRLELEIGADLEARGVERELKRLEKLFLSTLEERVGRLADEAAGRGLERWRTPMYPGIPTPPIYGPPQPTPPWGGR